MTDRQPKARIVGWAIVIAGAFTLGGSALYWLADGAVGTPQQFQDRVAEAGLDVEWRNVGPRAGDGSVETDCGTVSVAVNEIDGDLWLTANGEGHQITPLTVDDLLSCRSQ